MVVDVDFSKVLDAMFKELDYQLSLDVVPLPERLAAGSKSLTDEYGVQLADLWAGWFVERYAEDFYDTLSL